MSAKLEQRGISPKVINCMCVLGGLAWAMTRHTVIGFNISQLYSTIFFTLCLFPCLTLSFSRLPCQLQPSPSIVLRKKKGKKKKQRMDRLTFSGRQEEKPSQNLKLRKNTGEKGGKWHEGGKGEMGEQERAGGGKLLTASLILIIILWQETISSELNFMQTYQKTRSGEVFNKKVI